MFHCAIFSAYGQYLQQHYQTQRSTSSTNTRTDVMPRPPLPDYVTATHMASRRKQQAPLPPVSHARAHSFDNYSTPAPASVTSSHSSSQFFSVDVNERLVDGESKFPLWHWLTLVMCWWFLIIPGPADDEEQVSAVWRQRWRSFADLHFPPVRASEHVCVSNTTASRSK